MTAEDAARLRRSFALAREARARGDGAYGAVLLAADGALLAEAGNTAPTTGDASAHAEMNALREAAAGRGAAALQGSVLYASCEPCPMCATAAHLAGVRRVVFGIRASELARARGGGPLPWAPVEIPAAEVARRGGGRMAVEGPCLEDEAAVPHAGLGGA